MKSLLLPVAIATLIFSSCGNDKKVTDVQKNEDGTTTTTTYDADNINKMAESGDEMNKKIEELKKLKPLTTDQLKALLPSEINGIKQTEFRTHSAMGYAVAEGEYIKDDTTDIKLTVYDCSGEAGSGMYALTYWSAMNFQQESSKEYTKTIDLKGGKAVENYKKESNESSLTYIANDRLMVVLNGRNTDPAALKAAAENLNFSL